MYLILIIAVIIFLIAILIYVPLLQVKAIKKVNNTTQVKIQLKELENKFRITIAQIIAGFIILFGAYATFKNIDETKKKRLQENFNEATLTLSSKDSQNDLKKVASIYVIESITKEMYDEYYKTSMEIFKNYLEENLNRNYSQDSLVSPVVKSIFDVLGKQKHLIYNDRYRFLEFKKLNLKGLDIINGDFTRIYLDEVDLTNASFENTNFTDNYFLNTEFVNVNLDRCIFTNSNFIGSKFTNAFICGNKFDHVSFSSCDFRKIKVGWYGNPLKLQDFNKSSFNDCICDSISFHDGNFNNSNMSNSKFIKTNFENSQFQNTSIFNCDLSFTNLKNVNFENARIFNCNFIGSDLTGSNFENATFENCDFTGSILTESNFEKVKYLIMVRLNNITGLTQAQNISMQRFRALRPHFYGSPRINIFPYTYVMNYNNWFYTFSNR